MQNKPLDRIIVFSGGGTRFPIYCGMYGALEDYQKKPDLIIATCGGSIAASIINSFSTNEERKKYLLSEEVYNFSKSASFTKQRKLYNIGLLSLKKVLNKNRAPFIEDIFNKFLIDVSFNMSDYLPSLSNNPNKYAPSILVGSKILHSKDEVYEKRDGRKLYQKVLLTNSDTASLINTNNIEVSSNNFFKSAVDNKIEIIANVPMSTAVRISLSDMFYMNPINYDGTYYLGGAIDLMPIELANSLGKEIFFEKKDCYSKVEEAFVRCVFGYSGNQRLLEVEKNENYKWIDTRNSKKYLAEHYCKKTIDLLRLQVDIKPASSLNQHQQDIEVLWKYGYDSVVKTLEK